MDTKKLKFEDGYLLSSLVVSLGNDEDNKLDQYKKYSEEVVDNLEDNAKDLQNILLSEKSSNLYNTINVVDNYHDFCAKIESEKNNPVSGPNYYKAYKFDDRFILFKLFYKRLENGSLEFSRARLIVCYVYEKPNMKSILDEIFGSSFGESIIWQSSPEHFNEILINPRILEVLIGCKILDKSRKSIYFNFTREMKNGKVRELSKPNDEILKPLIELNNFLQIAYGAENIGIQFAYKKGVNIIDNADPHKDHRYMIKADISNFFPSCKRKLVKKVIEYAFVDSINWKRNLNYFLNRMLVDDALCLGNPISPTIANKIVASAARHIYNICEKTGIAFTQYCDDMCFSSDRPLSKKWVREIFTTVYTQQGLGEYFTLKEEKLVGMVGQQRSITSISYDHTNNNKTTNKRYIYEFIRVSVHKYSLGERNINLNKVRGNIAYMKMCGNGWRILKYLNKFGEDVKRVFMPEKMEMQIIEAHELELAQGE